ncbi:AAA family ATPase [Clostridium sediminicola]|uniref:AAA family ATPase n=1 Tax=Clostridium sediminicola TaxID=3114879 RepID=UPI0031F209A3
MNKEEQMLKTFMQCKKIDIDEFINIFINTVEALEEIHKKKIIHLDINPENILINRKGEVRIIDFFRSVSLKRSKLAYIAPEQTKRINKKVDYRADYYSLGICFYELLTGETPFKNQDYTELVYSHIAIEAIEPNRINKEIPKVISDIIMKLISKMPKDRYQNLKSLKEDLKKCKKDFYEKGEVEFFEIAKDDICNIFEISDKLYGRNEEIEKLQNLFQQIKLGSKELVLIKGYPGIGKSSLVKEINNKVVKEKAYFIGGKFQQFENNTPYSAIIAALKNLTKDLLKESGENLLRIRKHILDAIGNNGRVITEIIPSLKLIIGEQKSVPELGIIESQNRFNRVFQDFISVVSSENCPIVMFIDDMQWADSTSIDFIKMIMMNKSIKNLLIIGAYRDNESIVRNPLESMINELNENEISVNKISLSSLNEKDISILLSDTFNEAKIDEEKLNELSRFVFEKTGGNPFFIRQFLGYLYKKEYIWFNYEEMTWYWSIEEIKKENITENVVELLVEKIKILTPSVIEILKQGACIGNTFTLSTLAIISKRPSEEIEKDLEEAIRERVISVSRKHNGSLQENLKYSFLHDRIQQAIYSMISNSVKEETHLSLGKMLLKTYSNNEDREKLFKILWHYNSAINIIDSQEEKIKLAKLNLEASIMAKKSSAFDFSFLYLNAGIELLEEGTWKEEYELSLQLYSDATEGAYLINNYEIMDLYGEKVLKNAKNLIDKVKVYRVKIEAYQAQMRFREALEIGLSVLRLMGLTLPTRPNQTEIEKAFYNIKEVMKEVNVENLIDLPLMSNPIKVAAMEIMMSTITATYKANPMMTPILACKMVEFSVKYGNSPLSAGAYTFYGLLLCKKMNEIELGYNIGKLSINMLDRENSNKHKAIVLDMNSYCIKHWKDHLKSTLDGFEEGYRVGVENGNFENAACCLAGHAKNSFYLGRSLQILEEEIGVNVKNIERIKKCASLNYEKIFGQLVLNIQGKVTDPLVLTGEICNEKKIFSSVQSAGDLLGEFFLYLSKTILFYNFGDYYGALKNSEKANENVGVAAGMVDTAILNFYDSLSRLALYDSVSNNEKEQILLKISENQAKLKFWSKYAPMNFIHKYYLVEAELLRIKGETYKALEYYNKSILLAKENDYINEEALANELAAKFCLQNNHPKYAKLHFEEAYECYDKWGAEAKLKYLMKNYKEYLDDSEKNNLNLIETTASPLQLIDINTIMKANEAISKEIVLDELIKRLISILMENVGAQKVVIIMKEYQRFVVKGVKEANEEKISILEGIELDNYTNIPKKIINYVSRSKEAIIINDANNSVIFGNDLYLSEEKTKSVLCSPLVKGGKLQGIIYLENNLMTGTFTEDRLKVLEMLSSQIVISIENAKYFTLLEGYNEILEERVAERTTKLEEEKNKLQKYLDVSKDIFIVINEKGEITTINKRGCELLGDQEANIIGKNLGDNYLVDEERKKIREIFYSNKNEEEAFYLEGNFITTNGEKRKCVSHNEIIKDEHGNIESVLISALDITEIELLKEELQYNKLKIEFFANLSHELKTPLNLSFSALQMLDLYNKKYSAGEGKEKFEKYINIIKQNNYRLLKLVNNIVDITKINSNHFNVALENCDIVDIIKKITFSVSDYCNNKSRIVKFDSHVKKKIIACDAFSIERIMLNLFSNAVKCTDEGDEISVNIYEKENFIVIALKDSGTGIPEDRQKVIFDRFRQVDKSFTRRSEGSGLGLTIVKLLLELQGGLISVNSKLGEFTEFIIQLPIKVLNNKDVQLKNGNTEETKFIDVLDIEFSDVYGL